MVAAAVLYDRFEDTATLRGESASVFNIDVRGSMSAILPIADIGSAKWNVRFEPEATRARIGRDAYQLDVQMQCCGGLNFGYFYADSPIIAYDDQSPPAYTMGHFTPSTVPGCRAPHLWLGDGHSLYDALGPDYTLIRKDPVVPISSLVKAAAERGVPLKILDIDADDARLLYPHNLVLVRPDQHVAWRGDGVPTAPLELIDRIRGAALSES